jgi:hypothetical protein
MRDGQQSPRRVDRVFFVTSVPQRVVLTVSANLVKDSVSQLDQIEPNSNLNRIGEHRVEHRPIRVRQIQPRSVDLGEPVVASLSGPDTRPDGVSVRDDIK